MPKGRATWAWRRGGFALRLGASLGAVALGLGLGLTAVAQGRLSLAIHQVDDSKFPLLVSHATVMDEKLMPVVDLAASQWEVLEDGKPVAAFQVQPVVMTAEPLTVALVMDTSGSMAGTPLRDAQVAAATFLRGLTEKDKVALIAFASEVRLVQEFTADKEAAITQVQRLTAGGRTALYDALAAAAEALEGLPLPPGKGLRPGRKIIVVLTDGRDEGSRHSLGKVLEALAARPAPVFAVGLGAEVDRKVLEQIAQATGGMALYAPSPADLRTAYAAIAEQLRHQYAITFTSRLPADGQPHELTLRVRRGTLVAEAQARFTTRPIPPTITIVSPSEGQVVSGAQRVEVRVAAAGKVTKVELSIGGKLVAAATAEPFVLEWDASRLAAGEHPLAVTAYDSAGNRATKELRVQVAAPPATPTPEATPTPIPPPPPTAGLTTPVLVQTFLLLMVLASIPGLGVALRPRKCPRHGRVLVLGRTCPACAEKMRRLIAQRMTEIMSPWRCQRHGLPLGSGGLCPICEEEAHQRIAERLARITGETGSGSESTAESPRKE